VYEVAGIAAASPAPLSRISTPPSPALHIGDIDGILGPASGFPGTDWIVVGTGVLAGHHC